MTVVYCFDDGEMSLKTLNGSRNLVVRNLCFDRCAPVTEAGIQKRGGQS
jgi:hypothetical protein